MKTMRSGTGYGVLQARAKGVETSQKSRYDLPSPRPQASGNVDFTW